MLRVGETDLRGRGHVALYVPFARARGGDDGIPIVFEREGAVRNATLPVGSYRIYWARLPASIVFALCAVLLLLRAPPTRVTRAFAQTFMCAALFLACTFGGGKFETWLAIGVHVGSLALAAPLSVRAALLFPHGIPPSTLMGRLGPWAFAVLGPLDASRFYELPFPRAVGVAGMTAGDLILFSLLLIVATRAYRRVDALGKRQIRWVLLGVYLALLVSIAAVAMAGVDVSFIPLLVVSMAALALIPLSFLIAISRYNLFDVDRLISSTASYTVLGIALLAGVLAAVPAVSQAVSQPIGVDPRVVQLALSVVLAGITVPCHHWLRPRIDRLFFPERQALMQGMERLLDTLSSCREKRRAPLSGEGLSRKRRALELSPFDRAALETLGVPVVVPVHRSDALVAFISLGPKHSGDVYTSTDLALVAVMADKISTELLRFEQDEMIQQSRALQEALRRYVPGALVEELASGRELEVGEREVSVLFVDIRGYTSYAEDRRPEEIFSTVNRYTQCVSEIVHSHGGSVVEFNGDGMMAVFGAPHVIEGKERAATQAGREIARAVPELALEGSTHLEVGVGIATGRAFVGNIQAVDRFIWTAIGNTTNLAARLQSLTRELNAAVAIDTATFDRAGKATSEFLMQ